MVYIMFEHTEDLKSHMGGGDLSLTDARKNSQKHLFSNVTKQHSF